MAGWKYLAAAALFAMAPAATILAQGGSDLAKKIVNDPSAPEVNGAKASLVSDANAQGGKALRVEVAKKGKNPWDATVGGAIKKPVARGDHLVMLFSARLEKGENGAATATLPYNAVQFAAAPYSTVISAPAEIGPSWKDFKVEGVSDGAYGPGELKVTIQLATGRQTVDFGPIVVLDMGQ
jgi:hypothetical protein